jgi:hypothetical protein
MAHTLCVPSTSSPRLRPVTSWQDAEHNAVEWMRHWGFADASMTSGGADNGVDVRARGALAQVKFRAAMAGRPDLQRLVGARGRDTGKALLFFSGTGYSAHALVYADDMEIALFEYDQTGRVQPANKLGRRIADRAKTDAAKESSPISRAWFGLSLTGMPYVWAARAEAPGVLGWTAAVLVSLVGLLVLLSALPSAERTSARGAGDVPVDAPGDAAASAHDS